MLVREHAAARTDAVDASSILDNLDLVDLAAPQWVAHAGLDPRPHESGTALADSQSKCNTL